MSDEELDESEAPRPKKKKGGKLGIVIAIIATGGVVGAGTLMAPRLLAMRAQNKHEEEQSVNPMFAFQPIVVDVRATGEEMHHLKVTLTFELADGVKAEEFERLVPRGREAAIQYLRGLTFDDVTRPAKFADITRDMNEKVTEALGKQRVRRMMITDFVTQ